MPNGGGGLRQREEPPVVSQPPLPFTTTTIALTLATRAPLRHPPRRLATPRTFRRFAHMVCDNLLLFGFFGMHVYVESGKDKLGLGVRKGWARAFDPTSWPVTERYARSATGPAVARNSRHPPAAFTSKKPPTSQPAGFSNLPFALFVSHTRYDNARSSRLPTPDTLKRTACSAHLRLNLPACVAQRVSVRLSKPNPSFARCQLKNIRKHVPLALGIRAGQSCVDTFSRHFLLLPTIPPQVRKWGLG